jgi:hypothetical protein
MNVKYQAIKRDIPTGKVRKARRREREKRSFK